MTSALSLLLLHIEPIKIHHLGPSRHEIVHKLFLGIVAGIRFGDCSQLRVGTENQIGSSSRPFQITRIAITAFEEMIAHGRLLPLRTHVQQVHKEVIGQLARVLGQHTTGLPPLFRSKTDSHNRNIAKPISLRTSFRLVVQAIHARVFQRVKVLMNPKKEPESK